MTGNAQQWMDNWFAVISAKTQTSLSVESVHKLSSDGFVVIPGPVPAAKLEALTHGYDEAVSGAALDDIRIGSTTTRVRDFANRGALFDELYLHAPLLQACCRIIEHPFKLSTVHARTLRPLMPAQRLHVDFPKDGQGWPMVGFILMIDDFTPENGATCFLPGSQGMAAPPASFSLMPACGQAGSMIVFNGSVWHGHGPNQTSLPRRSIQGAYIRRTEVSGEALSERMMPETFDRIGGLAKYLLGV